MKKLRPVVALMLVVAAVLAVAESSIAGELRSKSQVLERALQLDRALVTPPHTSAQQHHLIAVTLAAHQTHTTDAAEIAAALDQLSSLVTYLVQSDTEYVWDGLSMWIPSSRTTYTYSSTKLTEWVAQDYDDTLMAWINDLRIVNTYNGSGKLSTSTSYNWVEGAWVNSSLSTFTYDGSGNVTYSLFQIWMGGAWVNSFNSTFTYSGALVATATTQMWAGSAWSNFRKNIYTYNGDDLTEDLSQGWTGAWIDVERITYTLDGSGRATMEVWQQRISNVWTNWVKVDYAYDGATENQTLASQYNWNGAAWDPQRADTSRYSAGKRIELVTYWFLLGSLNRTLSTYDGLGNLILEIEQTWTGASWLDGVRHVYVYVIAGIFDDESSGVPVDYGLLHNYPNPFNANTVIEYSLAHDGHVDIVISNILGQTVRTLAEGHQPAGRYTMAWDGHDEHGNTVASGIYFLRVRTADISQVRKMVLLK